MPIDNSITQRLNDFLDMSERTNEDIISGATLLLQLNRNRQLFQTVLTNPKRFESTVVYELKKFVPIRQRGQTLEDVQRQTKELLGELQAAVESEPEDNENKADEEQDLPLHKGKRADHDQLPDSIKAIWEQNAERWKKIKALYYTCQDIKEPCDRAESLNTLKETWYKYKSEFARYDDYVIENSDETAQKETTPVDYAKAITNARSYLSKAVKDDKLLNKRKAALADDADEKTIQDYNTSLQSVMDRVQLLLNSGEIIGDDLRQKLTDAGVVFHEEKPSETVEPSENTDSIEDKDIDNEQGQEN